MTLTLKIFLLYFLLIVGSLYQEFLDQLLTALSSNPCKLYGYELKCVVTTCLSYHLKIEFNLVMSYL